MFSMTMPVRWQGETQAWLRVGAREYVLQAIWIGQVLEYGQELSTGSASETGRKQG